MKNSLLFLMFVFVCSAFAQQKFSGNITYTFTGSEQKTTTSSIAASPEWLMLKSSGDRAHTFLYRPENDSLIIVTKNNSGEFAYIVDYKLLLDFCKKEFPNNQLNQYKSTQHLIGTDITKKIGQLNALLYKNENKQCYGAVLQFSFNKILPLLLLIDGWKNYDIGSATIVSYSEKDTNATVKLSEQPITSAEILQTLNNVKVISLLKLQQDASHDKNLVNILKGFLSF